LIKDLIRNKILQELANFEVVPGSEQRSVADLVEHKVKRILFSLECNPFIKSFLPARSKKSLEDCTLIDHEDHTFYVDIKTHDINAKFSMPNLTSIEKIRQINSQETKDIIYVFVGYYVENQIVFIHSIETKFIWELDFSMLQIGNLGKGQLQICNMKNKLVFTDKGKFLWFEDLKKVVNKFHKKRIKIIEKEQLIWQ